VARKKEKEKKFQCQKIIKNSIEYLLGFDQNKSRIIFFSFEILLDYVSYGKIIKTKSTSIGRACAHSISIIQKYHAESTTSIFQALGISFHFYFTIIFTGSILSIDR